MPEHGVLHVMRRVARRLQMALCGRSQKYPPDLPQQTIELFESVRPYTMTSVERVAALADSVRYIVRNGIPGSLVECGVWRGGSALCIAKTLIELNVKDRDIFLFDTFSGMSAPTDHDVSVFKDDAHDQFSKTKTSSDSSNWCYASLEEVRENLFASGYPKDRLHFIKGKVEDTLPENAPGAIALLRLDTDWYESTRHSMTSLFPLLSRAGILLVDDYGHWEGAKQAIDEYFVKHDIGMLLQRIDYTGRLGIKM